MVDERHSNDEEGGKETVDLDCKLVDKWIGTTMWAPRLQTQQDWTSRYATRFKVNVEDHEDKAS